jgi:hypothetical protein
LSWVSLAQRLEPPLVLLNHFSVWPGVAPPALARPSSSRPLLRSGRGLWASATCSRCLLPVSPLLISHCETREYNLKNTHSNHKLLHTSTGRFTRVPPRLAPPVSERSAPQSAGQSAPPSPEGPQPAKRSEGARGCQGYRVPRAPYADTLSLRAQAAPMQRPCSICTGDSICITTSPASSCLLSALTC